MIWNPDGSTAELSGNGTRIAAAGSLGAGRPAGRPHSRRRRARSSARMRRRAMVEQDMGDVDVGAPETLDVEGRDVEVTRSRSATPMRSSVRIRSARSCCALGPLIEQHPRFPERTNVQLVRVDGTHDVTAAVWERGAGETRASGTSACAVAAAAIANGWCESPVTRAHAGRRRSASRSTTGRPGSPARPRRSVGARSARSCSPRCAALAEHRRWGRAASATQRHTATP